MNGSKFPQPRETIIGGGRMSHITKNPPPLDGVTWTTNGGPLTTLLVWKDSLAGVDSSMMSPSMKTRFSFIPSIMSPSIFAFTSISSYLRRRQRQSLWILELSPGIVVVMSDRITASTGN